MALTKISGGVIQPDNFNVGVITATSLNAAGVVTASTVQVGSATTIHTSGIDLGSGSITSHNINSTGIITASRYIGNADITGGSIVATAATFTGNVSIGGTLTYEDVTNVDSVGLITARSGINIENAAPTLNLIDTDGSTTSSLLGNSGNIYYSTSSSNRDHIFRGSTTEVARITGDGNIGIGTDNPSMPLHLSTTEQNAVKWESSNSDGPLTHYYNGTTHLGNVGNSKGVMSSTDLHFGIGSKSDLLFGTKPSGGGSTVERLRITSTGNVGIGLTNPVTNLTVYGNASAVLFQNSNTGTTGGDGFFVGNYGGLTASIWQYENDVITFGTNNTERLRITSGGSVGIGTDNPQYKLEVQGATTPAIVVRNTTTSSYSRLSAGEIGDGEIFAFQRLGSTSSASGGPKAGQIWNYADAPIVMGIGSTERLRITSGGNMGLGVTPESWGTNFRAFQIGSTGSLASQVGARTIELATNAYNNSGWKYTDSDVASLYYQYNGEHIFSNAPSGTDDASCTFTERLRIRSNGDVILGPYDAPGSYTNAANNVPYQIKVAPYGWQHHSELAAISMGNHSGATGNDDGEIVFKTTQNAHSSTAGLVERLRITSTGNVGINQTNPNKAKLHVVGPLSSTQEIVAKFRGGSDTDAEGRIALVAGYSDTANDNEGHVYLAARRNGNGNSTSFSVYCSNGGSMTERLKVTNGGDLYLNGSNGAHRVVDEYAGSVSVTNANTDAFAFRMHGSSLGGGGKLYVWGTSGNVVVNAIAEIVISHSTHIAIQSLSNGYTQARIRVVTNNNESGDIYLGRHNGYGSGTTTLNWRFIPYGATYVVTSGGTYTSSSVTHATTANSFNLTATSGGNVNASGSKNFLIDHPLTGISTTTKLIHAAVEGPECNTIYRGKVDLVDGIATVNLDINSRMTEGTFEALNQNIQCYTTNETGWTAVKGSISGNLLTVTAQDNTCTDTVSWLVIAERKDQNMINSDMTDSTGRLIPEITTESNESE